MMTNSVDCDPDEVPVGVPVSVAFVPTDREDVAIPAFRLD
ncbi:hypothetical protein SAMN05216218_11147 [Halorientalis regularis]|uniref:DUF35 OB-fold domain-containing protein, acyl-CoA-associated n=1 Tax=Halorientalis regularis TaxID=660518 RepID=A0A1G7PW67_9EURY|nr:hypothetical protein SAMN05216218_11147 [Halorientalis regularis]